jgi:hypothetical protein
MVCCRACYCWALSVLQFFSGLLDDEDDPVETEADGNSDSQTKQPENSEK